MKRTEKAADLLLLGMLSIAVSFVAAQSLLGALLIDGMGQTLLYCAVFTVIWALMLYNSVTTLLLLLAPALAGFYGLMSFLWPGRFPAFIDYDAVIDFFQWCREYVMTLSVPREDYFGVLKLLVCGMTGLLVYVFTVKRLSFALIFFAGMGIFISQYVVGMEFSFGLFTAFVGLCLLYWPLRSHRRRAEEGRMRLPGAAGLLLFGLPLCLLAVLLAGRLPVPGEPLREPGVEDALLSAVTTVYEDLIVGETEPEGGFSLAQTGFGSVTNLSSRPALNDTLVMTVEAAGRTYLKGQVKDVYSGRAWKRSIREPQTPLIDRERYSFIRSQLVHSMTNVHLFWRWQGFEQAPGWPPYAEQTEVRITYRELSTRMLFLPQGTVALRLSGRAEETGEVREENGGTVSAGEILSYGYSYSAVSMMTDYRDQTLLDFLKGRGNDLHQDRGNVLPNVARDLEIPEPILRTELEGYDRESYEYGLQLPSGLPERVKALALQLTEGFDNRYDQARAIEQYLAKSFTYTLTPERAPLGRDYVDFLLFDSKEGFCTHFATAMTVLCRTVGIPARIAEGYVLPSSPEWISEEGLGVYEVTNEQAHAWVEVYFEGIGWIPFEPTAPYAALFYQETVPVTYSEEFLRDPDAAEHRELLSEFGNELPEPEAPEPAPAPTEPSGGGEKQPSGIPGWALWTMLAAAAVLLAFAGLRLLRKRRERSYGLPPDQSVPSLFERTLYLLRVLRLRRDRSETLSEFAGRAQRELDLPRGELREAMENYLPVR